MGELEEKHKIAEEILNIISEYGVWFNLEDIYRLAIEASLQELIKIKENISKQLSSISNYSRIQPNYRLKLETDEKGKIVSYNLVEDLPEYYLPPSKVNDLVRIVGDELIFPTLEEIKEELYEIEWKKLQSTIGLQEDIEEF